MNYLGVNQYAVCARCVRRSEPPISHDVFGQDVVVDALAPVARCVPLRAIVRVPFRSLRAVRVERQVNVWFDQCQLSTMLYELQRFLCKLGLTFGPGVQPAMEQSGAACDRNSDLTATQCHPSTSKESPHLQNVKVELTARGRRLPPRR